MKIGIIGPGGSGKTTLFNSLTGQSAQTGGSARKTHVGVVNVPDERLDKIQKLTGRKNIVYAQIAFSDVAGELAKPSREKGLDPELANMMKAMDAFAIVMADFPEYAASGGKVSPAAQASEMESDLILADLVVVENKIDRMKREPAPDILKAAIEKCMAHLEEEKPLRLLELNAPQEQALSSYGFLSRKPAIYIHNVGEDDIGKPDSAELEALATKNGAVAVRVSAKVEMEITQMDPAERPEFRNAMGITDSALNRFVRAGYEACNLISFFTSGTGGKVDESRAWTVEKNSTAFEAAGKIHSDIQRGFIRAEVTAYGDFIAAGGLEAAKAKGKARLEGKDYIVQDGDLILFRFNV